MFSSCLRTRQELVRLPHGNRRPLVAEAGAVVALTAYFAVRLQG